MSNFFQTITSVIIRPATTFRRLSLNRPTYTAASVFAVTILSVWISIWLSHNQVFLNNPTAFFSLAIPAFLVVSIGLLVLTSLVHLTADLLGGAGRGLTLLLFLMISTLPFWLIGLSALLPEFAFPINSLFLWLSSGWSILLAIVAVKEIYRFSAMRAISALLLPPAVLGGIAWIILRMMAESLSLSL